MTLHCGRQYRQPAAFVAKKSPVVAINTAVLRLVLSVLMCSGCSVASPCKQALPHVLSTVPVGRAPADVVAGDLNRDGAMDLVSADSGDRAVSVLLGHGDGAFAAAISVPSPIVPHLLALADLDRD